MPPPRLRKGLLRFMRFLAGVAVLCLVALIVFTTHCRQASLLFSPTPESLRHPNQAAGIANYARPEVDTIFTYPEWYIVWSYQSKADYQLGHLPSGYSYFGDIHQFWQAYCCVYAFTRGRYPFPTGDHIMLVVIGSSFTVEYALKGLYENTIGRFSEWTSHRQLVAEDIYAAQVAERYAEFVHVRPFYEFSFAHALVGLWSSTPFRATHLLRTIERRAWLTLDYSVEAAYCQLIEVATHATYGFEDKTTAAWIEFPSSDKTFLSSPQAPIRVLRDLGDHQAIVEVPRYQEFTSVAQFLLDNGVHFHQIAGNEILVISAIAPSGWTNHNPNVQALIARPLLTGSGNSRVVLLCRVPELHTTLRILERQGLKIEHLYDY